MSSLRSFLPHRARSPLLSSTVKQSLTPDTRCRSSTHNLQAAKAFAGLSTVSSIVDIILYRIASTRSDNSNASFTKASVAFSRARSNLFFASLSMLVVASFRSVNFSFLIALVSENISELAGPVATCVVSGSYALVNLVFSKTSQSSAIPSSKKLMLANKSFLAKPSNFDLISSISRTMKPRNFWSVTSPLWSLSAALSLPLLTSNPMVTSNTAVMIELML